MHVARLIALRLFLSALTLLFVSLIVFSMVEWLPGDVASQILGKFATKENLETLRTQLHLDQPAIVRYFTWLTEFVSGNPGDTLTSGRPIVDVVGPRLWNTILLSSLALVLYVPFAVVPAAVQAIHRDEPIDHAISSVTLILYSIPEFLMGTLLLLLFVVAIPILPATSMIDDATSVLDLIVALILPALTLAIGMASYAVRMLRDNLVEVLQSDYIRTAELNGLSPRRILWKHALRNSLIPTLNITALGIAYLIGGVVVVEKVFSFPGFGSLLVDSLLLRDVPLIEATVLIASAIYVAVNTIVDILTTILNPRLRAR